MKKVMLSALLSGVILFSACDKDDDDDNDINSTDRDFTVMAAMGNTAEKDAGMAASSKAMAADIREYGMMMVADHTPAQTELQTLATQLGLRAPDSLDAEHVALKAQLEHQRTGKGSPEDDRLV
jgi:putative membrane protein